MRQRELNIRESIRKHERELSTSKISVRERANKYETEGYAQERGKHERSLSMRES